MSSELGTSENPRKWRFTWEAQSHIPTLRLFLFDQGTKPCIQCKNLKVDLNFERSLLLVSWFEEETEISFRVPVPRVLVDIESPISFRAMEDHIEVKLVLLLPVDHHIVSNFNSILNMSEATSQLFSMDSDIKSLSSRGGVHFYCKSCSTNLTKKPLSSFAEMPSINWREVADNWFGACCCSFGGISEKLVARYANSYSCGEESCLLDATSVILCKDDLVGFEFPDRDGDQNYESEPDCTEDDCINEDMQDAGGNHGRCVCPTVKKEKMSDLSGKLNSLHIQKEPFVDSPGYKIIEKEITVPSLVGTVPVSYFSENVASAPGCCADNRIHVLNHDKEVCMPDTSEISKEQKVTKASEVLANKKSFLNGFLGNIFMARSYNLSKDVEWIKFACPQCSSLLGAYPCADGYAPLDGGVRLFKCYISTCLPVCESGDLFRKYTLERMFTSQLLESAKDELSFRTVVRDLRTKSPVLQIVLLNPNSWCCTGYCLGTEDTVDPVANINLYPAIKVLFSDCSYRTESQIRMIEEWVTKNQADEVYMLDHLISELIVSLEAAMDMYPPSYTFLQGLPLSSLLR